MNLETAYHLLGVTADASLDDLVAAKRAVLSHIHPDKHDAQHKHTFERLTSDVLEAFDVAKAALGKASKRRSNRASDIEQSLFDIRAAQSWKQAVEQKGTAVAPFKQRYAADQVLAVAVLGLDPNFAWSTTPWGGNRQDHRGSALYVIAWNRTTRRVENLAVTKGLLIDDVGNQYECLGSALNWIDPHGNFQRHGGTIAPSAKLDGFLLYPPLRGGARAFTRWFLADSFYVMGTLVSGEYDVALPDRPQLTARGLLPRNVGVADRGVDQDEDVEELVGAYDSLGHRWNARGICADCGKSRDAARAFGWHCESQATRQASATPDEANVPIWSDDAALKVVVDLLLVRDSPIPEHFASELRGTLEPALRRYRRLAHDERYRESAAYCEFAQQRLRELSE